MNPLDIYTTIEEAKDSLLMDIIYYEKKATYPWLVEKLRNYLSFWERLEITQLYNMPSPKTNSTKTENAPNKYYEKEQYRQYSIIRAIEKWPELF